MAFREVRPKRALVEVFRRDAEARAWDDQLRIDFNIQSARQGGLGSAKLTLYNLNETSIGHIRSRRAVVRVSAGFADGIGLVFVGTITRSNVDDTGVDTKVMVEATDGYGTYSSVRVNRSWSETTGLEVLRQLAADGGFANPFIGPDIVDVELPDGYTASGLWRTEMNDIVRTLGADFAIDGGVLQVVRRGQAIQRRAIIISEATGMIGIPRETGRNNLTLRTLLNPSIRRKQIVRIDTQGKEIFARVLNFSHEGSTWDSPFFTDLEVRKL